MKWYRKASFQLPTAYFLLHWLNIFLGLISNWGKCESEEIQSFMDISWPSSCTPNSIHLLNYLVYPGRSIVRLLYFLNPELVNTEQYAILNIYGYSIFALISGIITIILLWFLGYFYDKKQYLKICIIIIPIVLLALLTSTFLI